MQQKLSDNLSFRTRWTGDKPFASLGYDSLLSRIVEVKKELLKMDEQEKIIYSHWRLNKVPALCNEGPIESASDITISISHGQHMQFLQRYFHRGSARVHGICDWCGSILTGRTGYVKCFILTLAKSDVFIFTILFYVRKSWRNPVNGHRQKLFHDTSAYALDKPVSKLIRTIATCVPKWAPVDRSAFFRWSLTLKNDNECYTWWV